jgi:hypothetical protein
MVNFRGVRELRVAAIGDSGVVGAASPAGAESGLLGEALRFAFRGAAGDAAHVLADGAGFAHVEVALAAGRGGQLSLFRGIDRRGSEQVSLREDDGLRVTGGADEVAARLAELAGAPVAVWEKATFLDRSATGADPLDAPPALPGPVAPPVPVPPPAQTPSDVPQTDATELRDRAERAVDRLRRSLRAQALKDRVETDYAALCEFGARLRRERADAAVAIDRAVGERDRIRARIRRIGEYRELVAQQKPAAVRAAPAPKPSAPSRPRVVREAAAAAVVLLLTLVHVRTTPDLVAERALAIPLGLGFLAAAAWYVHVAADAGAARSAPRPREPEKTAGDEWREALRHRFADLGDPDDPRLLDDLRARIVPLDAEMEPLRKRLEQLDEALAAFEVEAGRAARVTHGALPPPPSEASSGLAPGESAAESVGRLGKLGDAVYHGAVERDALVAGGAETAAAAADAVRAAFRALGEALGDVARAQSALERAGLAAGDATALRGDADLCVRLSEEAAALGRRPSRTVVPVPPAPTVAATARSRPDVAALLGDVVERITGRQFVLVQDGSRIELRLQGPADPRPVAWTALPAAARDRLGLALRLRLAEAALGAAEDEPRFVVLAERPATLGDDAALAELVLSVAPRIVQVFVPSAPAPVPAPAAGRRALAGGGGPAPGVTPR